MDVYIALLEIELAFKRKIYSEDNLKKVGSKFVIK